MLLIGDCIASMRTLADNSVDSIVTDPPYGLTANKKGGSGVASVNLESPYGRARIGTGNGSGGFMGLAWDAGVPPIEVWAECLRVLKPGGHLLAFAGTRTQHRMAVRIEDAGFEIRDMIAWVYGSGFPKSLDVSKAIDKAAGAEREVVGEDPQAARRNKNTSKFSGCYGAIEDKPSCPLTAPATEAAHQWQGWGTALKPALEPITVARKPLIGTVAANVLAHGTGAINVDGCRVPTDPSIDDPRMGGAGSWGTGKMAKNVYEGGYAGEVVGSSPLGRWPANLIHDGSDDVLAAFPQAPGQQGRARTDGAAQGNAVFSALNHVTKQPEPRGDAGSAARFFYCAKASKKDRGEGNTHPTVKPTDLMRYLCRLVTPPGGVVLDPFMGSGSTGVAAILEGFDFIGCERDEAYFLIAKERVEAVKLW